MSTGRPRAERCSRAAVSSARIVEILVLARQGLTSTAACSRTPRHLRACIGVVEVVKAWQRPPAQVAAEAEQHPFVGVGLKPLVVGA